jgi:hypothetical protein
MRLTLTGLAERLRTRTGERWLTAGCFVLLFAAHSLLVRPVLQNGDTAVYNDQIDAHFFTGRAIHIGYFMLGALFHALLPFRTDTSMNVMALTFGVGAAYALYATSVQLGSRMAGVSSVLFLLCVQPFVRGMLLAEVDILHTSLVVMSYALYVRRWSKAAGAVFGLAMLVTPVSAATLPLFLATFALGEGSRLAALRAHLLRVFWFGLCGLLVYLPFVAWTYQSYVYGGRGLTTAPRMPFNLVDQAARSLRFFALQSWPLVALYVAGFVSALGERRLWRISQPALGIGLSVAATLVLADRTSDVPVQMPNVVLGCLLAGLLVARLAKLTRGLAFVVPLAAFAILAPPRYAATKFEIDRDDHERKLCEGIRAQSEPFQPMIVGVAGFNDTGVIERYVYGRTYVGLVLSVRQFRSRMRALQRTPESYQIWFWRNVPAAGLATLNARYELTQRQVEGATFRVLVPRARQRQ